MTLLELSEPLFQYVCRLKRMGRSGHNAEITHIRSEVKGILKDMETRASSDLHMANQFGKVRLPLIFFIDFMVHEAGLQRISEWKPLAYELNELAGDEKFFDLLDDELNDSSQPAAERLMIYHTCMGLGFTGFYKGQPEIIRSKMLNISSRAATMMDVDERSRICPEAYANVDTRNLIEPPGTKLVGIGIALLGLILVWFVTCLYLYRTASDDIVKTVHEINGTTATKAQP